MKWRSLLIGGAFIGVFSLGAMFAPINEPEANTNNENAATNSSIVQTTNETAEQAATDYTCLMTGAQMGNRAGMGKYFSGTMSEVIATELGITVDELRTARNEGTSIAAIAEEKGINVDVLADKMVQARTEELKQLVKDGQITQEQMDLMLENMTARMKTAIERDNVGPMHGSGGMGMGRGYHNRMGNQPL